MSLPGKYSVHSVCGFRSLLGSGVAAQKPDCNRVVECLRTKLLEEFRFRVPPKSQLAGLL